MVGPSRENAFGKHGIVDPPLSIRLHALQQQIDLFVEQGLCTLCEDVPDVLDVDVSVSILVKDGKGTEQLGFLGVLLGEGRKDREDLWEGERRNVHRRHKVPHVPLGRVEAQRAENRPHVVHMDVPRVGTVKQAKHLLDLRQAEWCQVHCVGRVGRGGG